MVDRKIWTNQSPFVSYKISSNLICRRLQYCQIRCNTDFQIILGKHFFSFLGVPQLLERAFRNLGPSLFRSGHTFLTGESFVACEETSLAARWVVLSVEMLLWIQIRINLQMASQNVWNMSLFGHFFEGLSLYSEARIWMHQGEKSDPDLDPQPY
jgi:hypothetical protein